MKFKLGTFFRTVSCLLVLLWAATPLPLHAAVGVSGLNVGIYCGTGAESSTILAMFRAVAALGHSPMGLTKADIVGGRLTLDNFDVLVIPPGEDGKKCCAGHYSDGDALDQIATKEAIRAYLNSGGGLVAEEAGAYYASQNGGTLDIYSGTYANVTTEIGKRTFTITDTSFGSGSQEAWQSYGGGYFPTPPSNVSVVAVDSSNRPVIVRQTYGRGRLIMTSFVLELRGDSELDWTIWDNWAMGGVHANSAGVWAMLGRMIGWAYLYGNADLPVIKATPNPTGARVAVVAQHTTDGGAWPGLLPAVARGLEYSGHLPLAVRFQEIKNGKLTLANFKVVTFPGGYAYGYKTGLAGYEGSVRSFISSGGSYYGICAGSFYAPGTILWQGKKYSYPLQIYAGQDIGPIDDIVPWPGYALTPVNFSGDSVIGNLGRVTVMYYGGGYHTLPTDAQQGAHVYTAGTFASSSAIGKADLVRYAYGKGKVALTTTHLETRAGSNDDWLFWDDYDYATGNLVINPDNPWDVMKAIFDHWLILP